MSKWPNLHGAYMVNIESHSAATFFGHFWHIVRRSQLVIWCLTSLSSTNMAISETKGQGWRAIPTQHRKAIVAFKAELYSNVLLYDFVIPQCPCDCYDHLTMSAWLPHGARAICTIVRSQCGAMRLVHEHRMTWSSMNFSHSPHGISRYVTM